MCSFSTLRAFSILQQQHPKCLRNKGEVSSFPKSNNLCQHDAHAVQRPHAVVMDYSQQPGVCIKAACAEAIEPAENADVGDDIPSERRQLFEHLSSCGGPLFMDAAVTCPTPSFFLCFVFLQPACKHRFKRLCPVDRSSFLAFIKPFGKSYCTAQEVNRRFESPSICALI